jgi:hypothetical protein
MPGFIVKDILVDALIVAQLSRELITLWGYLFFMTVVLRNHFIAGRRIPLPCSTISHFRQIPASGRWFPLFIIFDIVWAE